MVATGDICQNCKTPADKCLCRRKEEKAIASGSMTSHKKIAEELIAYWVCVEYPCSGDDDAFGKIPGKKYAANTPNRRCNLEHDLFPVLKSKEQLVSALRRVERETYLKAAEMLGTLIAEYKKFEMGWPCKHCTGYADDYVYCAKCVNAIHDKLKSKASEEVGE